MTRRFTAGLGCFQAATITPCMPESLSRSLRSTKWRSVYGEFEAGLVVLLGLAFRCHMSLVSGRHLRVGERDRHGAEDGGEFLVEITGLEIAHLDEVAVRVFANLVTPVPAFGYREEHGSLHSHSTQRVEPMPNCTSGVPGRLHSPKD